MPTALALTLMLKVITYDTAFTRTGEGTFVVLVPWAGDSARAEEVVAVAGTLSQKVILHRSLRFVAVKSSELSAKISELHPSALLAPQGTPVSVARDIARAAADAKIYSLALDVERVQDGIALGVGTDNDKPQLNINMSAARAEGCDFQPSVLKIAHTVQ
jgi:hypothetical protein